MSKYIKSTLAVSMMIAFYGVASAGGSICVGYGPQTPRDIDNDNGKNKQMYSIAPKYENMNLCNIHFHKNAEHKAKDFSIYVGPGKHGVGGGYKCEISEKLTNKELTPFKGNACNGIKPGDTIEVHWVFTSCATQPGKGLGSCLSKSCANPNLRVESQVFTVVNDAQAIDFNKFNYAGDKVAGYYQPKALPTDTGTPVTFIGSTTGPNYNAKKCSSVQATWSVRPQCAKVDINSLAKWCEANPFKEHSAHGVRKLVIDERLLAKIKD
ncbi:hypothetical protein PsalN5692_00184 [Piscirickettsia salmonis]|uniref:delta-class carbonic anhydrase n=2 Tax=Piscirickettsia salmonis TaxID=1238 RepID=UPI001E644264|nr:delta-class carbonic anhydrase [Piscirickettsia salmonis]QGP48779.1 hypothetical protein PsalN5692_00184 [Piscirickettsia salmonis]QGP52807.1 hypothetical protein PsalSR1_00198 [Piscirickettsia salmonis]QGP57670.1 hypothetical protein PsalBI1_00208 [Piscirickettsia salmonis]QGP62375.1 hypothetical protein PsalMR5_00198 [Piscirickettsia salmonis]